MGAGLKCDNLHIAKNIEFLLRSLGTTDEHRFHEVMYINVYHNKTIQYSKINRYLPEY